MYDICNIHQSSSFATTFGGLRISLINLSVKLSSSATAFSLPMLAVVSPMAKIFVSEGTIFFILPKFLLDIVDEFGLIFPIATSRCPFTSNEWIGEGNVLAIEWLRIVVTWLPLHAIGRKLVDIIVSLIEVLLPNCYAMHSVAFHLLIIITFST